MPYVMNIDDLRRLARRSLPRGMFDYLDSRAEAEVTQVENRRVFRDVTFRPRNAVALGACNLKTRVLGEELSFPALLAPVGYGRLMHPGGEVAAAGEAGVARALEILKDDVERTLRLLGCSAIAELDSSYLDTHLLPGCPR
jgi:isopentenyl diphosphate isomerase/L-lactate dehydrogenase-like FMN-dependent dehydrogenase